MSQGTEFHGHAALPAHPGRHRRGGAESWTPPLPQHRPVRHHAAGAAPEPGSPPLRYYGTGEAPEPGFSGRSRGNGEAGESGFSGRLRGAGQAPEPGFPGRYGGVAEAAETGSHPLQYRGISEAPEPGFSGRYRGTGRAPESGFASPFRGTSETPEPGFPGRYRGAAETAETCSHPLQYRGPSESREGGDYPFRPRAAAGGAGEAVVPGRSPWVRHTPLDPAKDGDHPLRLRCGDSAPADPPVSGSLPLALPALPQPREPRPSGPLFPASHGSLPLSDDDLEPGPDEAPVVESHAEQAARRTRVSLAAPTPRCVDLDEDDVRVYSAPPIDGLGGFTIGSVPASVTPPKTWRKAAWFATGASGAVVVGLLCAGSFLVGKPPMDEAVQGAWPGYQGAPTLADPTADRQPPTQGGSAAGPETATRPQSEKPQSGGGAGPVDGSAPPPAVSTAAPDSATTGAADPSAVPRKPAVTPAQRETPVKPPWWYSFPPDAQTMGDNSEKFFNTVTTDPSAASSVTTGRLHDQGPQALAERYAGIAYFEVKKVSIDQQRGVTVNTVEVTHTDGTKTIEERTLTFGDGDKITADGQ